MAAWSMTLNDCGLRIQATTEDKAHGMEVAFDTKVFVSSRFAMPSSLASAGAGRLGWAQEQGSAYRKPVGALPTEF